MTHRLLTYAAFRKAGWRPALAVFLGLSLVLAARASGQNLKTKASAVAAPAGATAVSINHVALDGRTLAALEMQLGSPVAAGDYWYDAFSGLFGLMGGPGQGFTVPGLELGGALPADASHGDTNVFVNGRELHQMDVAALMAVVGAVYPGRYWLRYDGYYGVEGGPALGNLMAIAQQQGQGGAAGYNRTAVGGHIGSDGQTSFYMDPGTGCSVIPGGGVSC